LTLSIVFKAVDRVSDKAKQIEKNMKKLNRTVSERTQKIARALDKAGKVMMGIGAGLTAAAGGAIYAAAKFEQAMVSVRKTTGLGTEEMAKLSQSILDMSTRIPKSAEELAEIAEVAGQLGISGVDNIAKFTETVAKMATADESLDASGWAQYFAQLSNVFGVSIQEASRMGSAINELANTTTAQGAYIANVMSRIGKPLKSLTFEKVAALAATMSDLGLSAERGGTAMRNVFTIMASSSEKVAKFLGMSRGAFEKALGEDAMGTLILLLKRLRQLDEVTRAAMIEELFGREGVEAVSKLAAGVEVLQKNLATSTTAWQQNTSLEQEFASATQSLMAQFKLLVNQFKAFAVNLGAFLLPAIKDMVSFLQKVVKWFSSLPKGVQKTISYFMLFGGIGLIAAGSIMRIVSALMLIKPALGGVKAAMMGVFASPWGLALVGIIFGITMAIKHWDEISKALGATWKWLHDHIFKPVWNFLKAVFGGFVVQVRVTSRILTTVFKPVGKFLTKVFITSGKAISKVWTFLAERIFKPIGKFLKAIFTGIAVQVKMTSQVLKAVFEPVGRFLLAVFDRAWRGIKSVWEGAKRFFAGLYSFFKSIGDSIKKLWDVVADAFKSAWKAAVDFVSGIVGAFVRNAIKALNVLPGVDIPIPEWALDEKTKAVLERTRQIVQNADLARVVNKAINISLASTWTDKLQDFVEDNWLGKMRKELEKLGYDTKAYEKAFYTLWDTVAEKMNLTRKQLFGLKIPKELGVDVLRYMATAIDKNGNLVLESVDRIFELISRHIAEKVSEGFKQATSQLGEEATFGDAIKTLSSQVWNWLYNNIFKPVWNFMKVVFEGFVVQVRVTSRILIAVFKPVGRFLVKIFATSSRAISKVWSFLVEKLFKPTTNLVKAVFTGVAVQAKITSQILQAIFEPVGRFLLAVFDRAWRGIKSVWERGKRFFRGLYDFFKTIGNSIKKVWDAITGGFRTAWEKAVSVVTDTVGAFIRNAIKALNLIPGIDIPIPEWALDKKTKEILEKTRQIIQDADLARVVNKAINRVFAEPLKGKLRSVVEGVWLKGMRKELEELGYNTEAYKEAFYKVLDTIAARMNLTRKQLLNLKPSKEFEVDFLRYLAASIDENGNIIASAVDKLFDYTSSFITNKISEATKRASVVLNEKIASAQKITFGDVLSTLEEKIGKAYESLNLDFGVYKKAMKKLTDQLIKDLEIKGGFLGFGKTGQLRKIELTPDIARKILDVLTQNISITGSLSPDIEKKISDILAPLLKRSMAPELPEMPALAMAAPGVISNTNTTTVHIGRIEIHGAKDPEETWRYIKDRLNRYNIALG